MILGFERPVAPSYGLDGTGAAWLTDVRLANGRPAQISRLQWLSTSSPEIGDYLDIQVSWATAAPVGLIATLGLSCGAGVRFEVTARRPIDGGYTYDLGGDSMTQRTVARSDGRVRHIVRFDQVELIGYQIRIYNDRNGSTWATPATALDIGEMDAFRAAELCIRPGYSDAPIQTSDLEWTLGSQPHTVARRNRRQRSVDLAPATVAELREQGLAGGSDWWRIDHAMSAYTPIISIPEYADANALHETALFGVAQDRGPVRHIAASLARYERPLVFAEAPEA
jgi:hypothetical protein